MLKRLMHKSQAYSKRHKIDQQKQREAEDLLLKTGPQKFQPEQGTRTEPLTEQDWRDVTLINGMLEAMELDRRAIHDMPFPVSLCLCEQKAAGTKLRQAKFQLFFATSTLSLPAVELQVEYTLFGEEDVRKYPLSRLAEYIGVVHDRSSVIQAVKLAVAEISGHYGRLRAMYDDACQRLTYWFSDDWTKAGVHEFDLTHLRKTASGMRRVQFINGIDIELPLEAISLRVDNGYVPKEGYFTQLRAFLESTLPCIMSGDSHVALQNQRDAVARWTSQNPLPEAQLSQPISTIQEKATNMANMTTLRSMIVANAAMVPEPEYDLF